MAEIESCPDIDELDVYAQACSSGGGSAGGANERLRRHVARCPRCFKLVTALIGLEARESEALLPPPSPAFLQGADRFLASRSPSRQAAPRRSNATDSFGSGLAALFPGFGLLFGGGGSGAPAPLGAFGQADHESTPPANFEENSSEGASFGAQERSNEMHDAHSGPTPPADASHPEERDMTPASIDRAIHEAPHQVGLHGSADVSNAVFQRYDDTCVIRCQQLVLQQYGVQVSQEQLIHEAKEFGWYREGHGVSGRHVGDLLSVHGVENAKYQNANVFNLATELAQGHKVIIGVDSGDLWGHHPIREWLENAVGIRAADHAVIVSGIDTTDPNDVKVIITDPGTGDVAKPYPLADFLSAWKDSNFFMVATKTPAPLEFNPEMAHFNYQTGHLPYVGRLDYDHFSHDYSACSDAPADSPVIRDQADQFVRSLKHGDELDRHDARHDDDHHHGHHSHDSHSDAPHDHAGDDDPTHSHDPPHSHDPSHLHDPTHSNDPSIHDPSSHDPSSHDSFDHDSSSHDSFGTDAWGGDPHGDH